MFRSSIREVNQGGSEMQILENLSIERREGIHVFVCTGCDTAFGPAEENYKKHCHYRERPMAAVGRLFDDSRKYVDDDIVYREFLCQNCGRLFDTEIMRKGELPVHDIQLPLEA